MNNELIFANLEEEELDDKKYILNVAPECEGNRIDVVLTQVIDGTSRAYIQRLISSEHVKVNNRSVKANYKLRKGDHVEVDVPEPEPTEVKPEDIPLDILFEDEHIIIINKKRGMVVHPAVGNYHGTLVNALLYHCKDLSGINGVLRPGIVHRLDKDTSGVMVAAKSDIAHIGLAKQIKEHTARRTYFAIVHGNVVEDKGMINAPIGRHPVDRKKMAVVFHNSKEAVTRFAVLERFGQYTLLQCILDTGRTHQIRVHMNYIGHPVLGDPVYGPKKCNFSIAGQALHSTELKLVHPITMEQMQFRAPLPNDMECILGQLRRQ